MIGHKNYYSIIIRKSKQSVDSILTCTNKILRAVLPTTVSRQFELALKLDLQSKISSIVLKIYKYYESNQKLFALNQAEDINELWEDPDKSFLDYECLSAQIYYVFSQYIHRQIEEARIKESGESNIPSFDAFLGSLEGLCFKKSVIIDWYAIIKDNVCIIGKDIYINSCVTISDNTIIFGGVMIGMPLSANNRLENSQIHIGSNVIINSGARIFCNIESDSIVGRDSIVKWPIPESCRTVTTNSIVSLMANSPIVGVKVNFKLKMLKIFGDDMGRVGNVLHCQENDEPVILFHQNARDSHTITYNMILPKESDLYEYEHIVVKIALADNDFILLDLVQYLWDPILKRGGMKC